MIFGIFSISCLFGFYLTTPYHCNECFWELLLRMDSCWRAQHDPDPEVRLFLTIWNSQKELYLGPARVHTMGQEHKWPISHVKGASPTNEIIHAQRSRDGKEVVGCPTRWSLLLTFGFLWWSSSWWWQPHIAGCKLFWPLSRSGMTVLGQFFCKMYFKYVSRGWKKLVHSFCVLRPQKRHFFS